MVGELVPSDVDAIPALIGGYVEGVARMNRNGCSFIIAPFATNRPQ